MRTSLQRLFVFVAAAAGTACTFTTDLDALQTPSGDSSAVDRRCTPQAGSLFCATFDQGSVAAGWSDIEQYGPVTLELDTKVFFSEPASFFSAFESLSAGVTASARLAYALPLSTVSTKIAFDVLPHFSLPSLAAGEVELAGLHEVTQEDSYFGVILKADTLGPFLFVDVRGASGRVAQRYSLPPFPDGWFRVTLEIALADTEGRIEVHYDDRSVSQLTGLQTRSQEVKRLFVDVGLYGRGTVASSAHFDNVRLDHH